MLKETDYIIAKKIESGQYFEDSLEWFIAKYGHIICFRSIMVISLLILCAGLGFMIVLSQMTFTVKSYPFPVYAIDEVNYFPNIKSISSEKEPINVSVARYLSGKYVILREEYRFSDQNGELKSIREQKIRNFSSFKVFRGYLNLIDPDYNYNSPLIIYKNHTQRVIKVENVTLRGNSFRPDSAVVLFKSIEKGRGEEKISYHNAYLEFNMSDIEKIFKKESRLSFVVTNYKTERIS